MVPVFLIKFSKVFVIVTSSFSPSKDDEKNAARVFVKCLRKFFDLANSQDACVFRTSLESDVVS